MPPSCIVGNVGFEKEEEYVEIKQRCLWLCCIDFDNLFWSYPSWVQQCYRGMMIDQWTALQNLLPTLPTRQLCHWRTSFTMLHAAFPGATNGFLPFPNTQCLPNFNVWNTPPEGSWRNQCMKCWSHKGAHGRKHLTVSITQRPSCQWDRNNLLKFLNIPLCITIYRRI